MVQKSITLKAIRFIAKDLVFDVLYWPIWWYTGGVKKAFNGFLNTLGQANRELSLTVWMKNIFVPMFGDFSWQGRLISFFMRIVQVIGRVIVFCVWLLFGALVFLFWAVLPIFIVYQVLFNFNILPNLL